MVHKFFYRINVLILIHKKLFRIYSRNGHISNIKLLKFTIVKKIIKYGKFELKEKKYILTYHNTCMKSHKVHIILIKKTHPLYNTAKTQLFYRIKT